MMRVTALRNNKPVISEKTFQAQVIALAHYYNWICAHFRPGLTKRGRWITAVQGDGAGFPDCVLIRGERVIFAELKSNIGKVTEAQDKWLRVAAGAHIEIHVWRPKDYDAICEALK